MMELEHFTWDFLLSLVLSDIDLFHTAFFELLFSQKGLIQLLPFNCHQEVLALLFIYLFIIINGLKKEIIPHLKWEPSATSSLPHKISKHLK